MPEETGVNARLRRLGALQLAERMAAGELSSEAVVEAHLARAVEVNGALNALVAPLFAEARAAARAADAARAGGGVLGALHGVPVRIKESIDVAGTPDDGGAAGRAARLAAAGSPLVARLQGGGRASCWGRRTCRSSCSTTRRTTRSTGGRTTPGTAARAPGGSSGGEAAMLAAGASALGLGSDIGGSIRVPPHCCGIQGLKPTPRRVTRAGDGGRVADAGRGGGPLAARAAGARGWPTWGWRMRVLAAPGRRALDDPADPPVPLARPRGGGGGGAAGGLLRGRRLLRPPRRRCAAPCARRPTPSRARGAWVERFAPPDVPGRHRALLGLLGADAGRGARARLAAAASRPTAASPALLRIARLPAPLAPRRSRRCWRARGSGGWSEMLRGVRAVRAAGYWRRVAAARRLPRALSSPRWTRQRLDAVLCPPARPPRRSATAPPTGSPPPASYAFLFNLLGMPAGTVAATRVRAGEESDRDAGRDRVERAARAPRRPAAPACPSACRWPRATGARTSARRHGRRWRRDFQDSDEYPVGGAVGKEF